MKSVYGQAAAADIKKTIPNSYLTPTDRTKSMGLNQRFNAFKYYENVEYKSDLNGGRNKDNMNNNFMRESKPFQPSAKDDWIDINGFQHIHFLDDASFDNFVKTKKKVLVMFYANWCSYCKSIKPIFGEAAADLNKFSPGHSYLAVVDATKSKDLAHKYEIKVYPTFKFFENGVYKFDFSGYKTKDSILSLMKDPKTKGEL